MTEQLDSVDRVILGLLQENARITNADLARRVEMAPSAVLERVRKLEERGLIAGYEARLNPKALGTGLLAFIFVRSADRVGELSNARRLAEFPEVQEVHHITGEDCFLIKVRVRDTEDLGRLLNTKIGAIPTILSTRTTIVLNTVKETTHIPVANSGETGREP
jgi:Lrp/AsnC family leucine-responsive transcriptional regulator